MSKGSKIAIGIAITISTLAVALVVVFCVAFVDLVNDIKDKIDSNKQEVQIRNETYDSITEELFSLGILSEDLIYVGKDSPWGYKSADVSKKYYFYIDSINYDKYKHYWLEGISNYQDGYNSNLGSFGHYVFTAVYVSDLSYAYNTEYRGVDLLANKTYYTVRIYDKAIYYKYVRKYGSDDNPRYHEYSGYNIDDDSLSEEYIFYQDNNKWVAYELPE